jgi:hypothetical protein
MPFDAEEAANAAEISVLAWLECNLMLIAIKLDGYDKFC